MEVESGSRVLGSGLGRSAKCEALARGNGGAGSGEYATVIAGEGSRNATQVKEG